MEAPMKGHVIINRVSKAGTIFVPEAHIQMETLALEEEVILHGMRTYPDGGEVWSSGMESQIKAECEFAAEVDVTEAILRLARYSIERNDAINEAYREARKRMEADGVELAVSLNDELHKKYYGHIDHKERYPDSLSLDRAARFDICRTVQGWILNAGGLI